MTIRGNGPVLLSRQGEMGLGIDDETCYVGCTFVFRDLLCVMNYLCY